MPVKEEGVFFFFFFNCMFYQLLIRNVSPSLGLSDNFPVCEILNYMPGRAWSLMVYIFEGCPGTLLIIHFSHFQWSVPK